MKAVFLPFNLNFTDLNLIDFIINYDKQPLFKMNQPNLLLVPLIS